jgi:hypothetical protein
MLSSAPLFDDLDVGAALEGVPLDLDTLLDGEEATFQAQLAGAFYRCLDSTHSSQCTRCSPPPVVEEEETFALVAEDGGGSGNKKLRGLLLLTPEWGDDAARAAAAHAARDAGQEQLAALLTQRASSGLNKRSCYFLCRLWSYRSDLWRAHAELRQRKRQRTALAASAGGGGAAGGRWGASQQGVVAVVVPPALSLSLTLQLFSLESKAHRAAVLLSAPGFRSASAVTGCGGFMAHRGLRPEDNFHVVLGAHLRDAATRLIQRFPDQVSWQTKECLEAAAMEGLPPACLPTNLETRSPAEDALEQFRVLLDGAQALRHRRRVDSLNLQSSEWPQSLNVLFEEMEQAMALLFEVSSAIHSIVQQQRATGTISSFSEMGLGIMRLLAALHVSCADALEQRDQWSQDLERRGIQPLPASIHTNIIRTEEFFPVLQLEGAEKCH